MHHIIRKKIVYSNRWLKIKSKKINFSYKDIGNYYSVHQKDYVYVLLKTSKSLFPMVKQFRHAINKYTLEFPSGCLEKKETPNICAKKEVLEETGHKIDFLKKIGTVYPDSGRLANKVHMYFATSKANKIKEIHKKEGIKVYYFSKNQIINLIKKNKILHQPHIGLFYTAIIKKLI